MKKFRALLFSFCILASALSYSQCAIFTPSMSITQFNPGSPPFGEDVTKAIDGNIYTKYLNFNRSNTGLIVNTARTSIATRMDLITANDFPERDPVNYTIEGSNNGTSWTSIASGSIPCNNTRFLSRSFTFSNSTSYSWYRIIFPNICNFGLANSMQVAEVQLYANSVTPSVSITRSANNLCAGSNITFTAAPVNGGTPTYQWRRNGSNISGATSSVWTTSSINNGDAVTCVMSSTAVCASPASVTSNSLSMSVNSRVTPTVFISGNPSVDRKTPSTFTAMPTNGGASPTYQWYKNNVLRGSGSSFTDTAWNKGTDTIRLRMKTSLTCVTTDSAWSTFFLTVLSLKDIKYRLYLDTLHLEFVKENEDMVNVFSFDAKTGKSDLIVSTSNKTIAIKHVSNYYYIVSEEVGKMIGPFPLVSDDPKRYIISTKQLLGQYTQ